MSHPSDGFTTIVHPEVKAYLDGFSPPDPFLDRLEAYAAERNFPLIGRQSGRLLTLLATLIGARRVFELGSGWGYSAYFFAQAVGDGGEVIGTDRDAHEIEAFEKLFAGHPLKGRILLEQGDALAVLEQSLGFFDIILLDLDKESYARAFDVAVPRLRPGGLLVADNVLWGGKVTREADNAATATIQEFNRKLFGDPRMEAVVLPVGDGLAVGRRR